MGPIDNWKLGVLVDFIWNILVVLQIFLVTFKCWNAHFIFYIYFCLTWNSVISILLSLILLMDLTGNFILSSFIQSNLFIQVEFWSTSFKFVTHQIPRFATISWLRTYIYLFLPFCFLPTFSVASHDYLSSGELPGYQSIWFCPYGCLEVMFLQSKQYEHSQGLQTAPLLVMKVHLEWL